MGRLLTWLTTTPILVVGLFAGHEFGYRLAVPDPNERAHELGHTGHDYFAYVPYLGAVVAAVVVVSLGLRAREAISGRHGATPSWAFALLPPLGFVLLETMERLRAYDPGTMTAPGVVAGLLLQLPFAFAALLVARLLASLADAVGLALKPMTALVVRARRSITFPPEVDLPRIRVVALPYGERGPPAL